MWYTAVTMYTLFLVILQYRFILLALILLALVGWIMVYHPGWFQRNLQTVFLGMLVIMLGVLLYEIILIQGIVTSLSIYLHSI